jgi:hypothetical protein
MIYKINQLDKTNTIIQIYVFIGDTNEDTFDITKVDVAVDYMIDGDIVFNTDELAAIQQQNIPVSLIKDSIYLDDDILSIKLKLLYHISNHNYSFEEMYLYCCVPTVLNTNKIYEDLTLMKNIPLNSSVLHSFLLNINISQDNSPEAKTEYSIDDLFGLQLDNKEVIKDTSIGQNCFIESEQYEYTVNPFKLSETDKLLQQSANEITLLNSHLLLNLGEIHNNNIYLCLTKDVLAFHSDANNSIREDYIIKLYYPFLYKNKIDTTELIDSNSQKLITNTEKMLTDRVLTSFKSLNMFYGVYQRKTKPLDYKKIGVEHIKFCLHPDYSVKIPLETIFKLIHAKEENPLIKYNFSSRQDNIYRLYVDKVTEDGEKIPLLLKSQVFKLMKTIGRSKSVAVYIAAEKMSIVCEFFENGDIIITGDFDSVIAIDNNFEKVNEPFLKYVNPIIQTVETFFQQNGYTVNEFVSVTKQNVEIIEITYKSIVSFSKKISVSKFKGCVNTAFIVNSETPQNINMIYKRVHNFNKLNSQEIYIAQQIKNRMLQSEIIEGLMETYQMDEASANDIYFKFINEKQVIRGLHKKDISTNVNPGFNVDINIDRIRGELTITILNIDNIQYLNTIPVFIDTFLRLNSDKSLTTYPVDRIDELCSKEVPAMELVEPIVVVPELPEPVVPKPQESQEVLKPQEPQEVPKPQEPQEVLKPQEPQEVLKPQEPQEVLKPQEIPKPEEPIIAINKKKSMFDLNESESEDEESSSEKVSNVPQEVSENVPKEISENVPKEISENVPQEVPENIPQEEPTEQVKINLVKKKNLMDLSSSSESSSSSSSSSSGGDTKTGEGPKKKQNDPKQNDIDGMSLSNPYYFQQRIKERAKSLFVRDNDEGFKGYSRMCPSSVRRQPVSLTKAELDKIQAENPDYLKPEDILPYSSNSENKDDPENNYYICPRYWCLLTNSPITEEEVKSGKCGKIITDTKEVKPGHYIYEFSAKNEHLDANNEYIKHYPGFHADSTPNGKCLPCCFKNWNTEKHRVRKQECNGDSSEEQKHPPAAEAEAEAEESKEEAKQKEEESAPLEEAEPIFEKRPIVEDVIHDDQYIMNSEKFPLDSGRWGYLPISVQKFFGDISCRVNDSNKSKTICLLRRGVEKIQNRSFIACISDAIFFAEHNENGQLLVPPKIISNNPNEDSITNRILNSMNIDTFINYQNATLVESFYDKTPIPNDVVEQEFEAVNKIHKQTKLYKKSEKGGKIEEKHFLLKVVNAFENFKKYLLDESVMVDYTYLWDMISSPNPLLFKKGINLVILNIPEDDSTNNIEYICPSNHYSINVYDPRKRTIFIIKRNDVYEPIYEYRETKTKIIINKSFSEYDNNMPENLKALFKNVIKPIVYQNCTPTKTNNMYHYQNPVTLDELSKRLHVRKYEIIHQVLNLQGKVIGVTAVDTKDPRKIRGFLPCYPTKYDTKYSDEYIFITNETDLWNTYENTLYFLNKWFLIKQSQPDGEQKCGPNDPFCKVVEDDFIVGFLTNTNQFIQLSEPKENMINDVVHVIHNNDYLVAENEILSSDNKVDTQRTEYVNKIRLEYNFYSAFRKTVRILLNDYANLAVKTEIDKIINNTAILYTNKLRMVRSMLETLLAPKIDFIDNIDINVFKEITPCVSYEKDKCTVKNPTCLYKVDNCVLILPRQNLVTKIDNEEMYYMKVSDELVRYSHVKSFIMKKNYLSFDKIGYNLLNNEIIILQSLLTPEYFDRLVSSKTNKYFMNNSFDNTNPSNAFINNVPLDIDEIAKNKRDELAAEHEISKISSLFWRTKFPSSCVEHEYPPTKMASFQFMIDIIQRAKNVAVDENTLREDLVELYTMYSEKYKSSLANIWIDQGKKLYGNKVHRGVYDFKHAIMDINYNLTNIDLWMLLVKYEVPSMFISSPPSLVFESNYNKNVFTTYKDDGASEYVFIHEIVNFKDIGSYRVIERDDGIMIDLDSIQDKTVINEALQEYVTIEHFLGVYELRNTTKYVRKKKDAKPPPILIQPEINVPKKVSPLLETETQTVVQKRTRRRKEIQANKPRERKPKEPKKQTRKVSPSNPVITNP